MANFLLVKHVFLSCLEAEKMAKKLKIRCLKNRDFVKKNSSNHHESKCRIPKGRKLELRLNNFTNSIKIKVLLTLGHIFEEMYAIIFREHVDFEPSDIFFETHSMSVSPKHVAQQP